MRCYGNRLGDLYLGGDCRHTCLSDVGMLPMSVFFLSLSRGATGGPLTRSHSSRICNGDKLCPSIESGLRAIGLVCCQRYVLLKGLFRDTFSFPCKTGVSSPNLPGVSPTG